MEPHFALPVSEGSITGVRCSRDVDVRIVFEREEPRECAHEREVGAPKTAMRVLPSPSVRCALRPFAQEAAPLFVPAGESMLKSGAPRLRECEGNRAKLLPRLKLRPASETGCDERKHVEMTVLHGYGWEPCLQQLPYSSSPVDRERREPESCSFQRIETGSVVFDALALDLLPVQVPPVRAADEETVAPREERGIHREANRKDRRTHLTSHGGLPVEVSSDGLGVFLVVVAQLIVGLFANRVVVVSTGHPRGQHTLMVRAERLVTARAAFV